MPICLSIGEVPCIDHIGYPQFDRWREALGRAAGFPTVIDHRNEQVYVDLPWERFTAANMLGEWPEGAPAGCDDPLIFLLAHADNEGVIHPEQGRHLLLRLRELKPATPDLADTWARFYSSLQVAVDRGEDLVFG
jgi:hypothetical protein